MAGSGRPSSAARIWRPTYVRDITSRAGRGVSSPIELGLTIGVVVRLTRREGVPGRREDGPRPRAVPTEPSCRNRPWRASDRGDREHAPLLPFAHCNSDGIRAPPRPGPTLAAVVPMQRVHCVESGGASAGRPTQHSARRLRWCPHRRRSDSQRQLLAEPSAARSRNRHPHFCLG